jgi:carbonic anhydrase
MTESEPTAPEPSWTAPTWTPPTWTPSSWTPPSETEAGETEAGETEAGETEAGETEAGPTGPDDFSSYDISLSDAVANEGAADQIGRLLAANEAYAGARASFGDHGPGRHLAVVTCMDARIDVFAALGLHLGEALVIRNAGGRVTDDVLRSLALATHVLGVDTVVVMEHTKCGLAGVSDEELQVRTGAELGFLPIEDHTVALRDDIDLLAAQPYLGPLVMIAGFTYDVETGEIDDVVRWQRPG